MLEQFLHHIQLHHLVDENDRVLLAVSGGIDSMVMMHLFKEAGWKAAVAHCNFQLRGTASDEDETFVEKKASEYGFAFHTKRFETKQAAEQQGISTQMAARELRYTWFNELCREHGYTIVATAHHLNDSLETLLLHLTRGTGLDGLVGVPVRQGNIIRPLLFASRDLVEQYANQHTITWREDRSNHTEDYQRNFIRHRVVPLLREINPSLDDTFRNTIERIAGGQAFASGFVEDFRAKEVTQADGRLYINREALLKMPFPAVLLWEIIKTYGFNFDQCRDVIDRQHQSGTIYKAGSYQLTIDRNDCILHDRSVHRPEEVLIQPYDTVVTLANMTLNIKIVNRANWKLTSNEAVAQLDAGQLQFPLRWRHWQEGDRFIPLGMKHHKKVSDFLVDRKVALPEKERVTVIESGGEIVWVAGHRIAEPVKVTDSTNKIIMMKMEP